MKPLKIYIVEDEPLIAANIEIALKKHGHNVIGDGFDYSGAIIDIEKLRPDLVLLDIQLEGDKDGIDLAFYLDKKSIPYLYLTSQTDPSTIDRVKKTKPLGYIVKPFTEAGLCSNIDLAWHNYNLSKEEYILIKSEGRTHKINQSDIRYLKAFDNYCYIITIEKKYIVPHTLKHTTEKLNPLNFIKTHRSYLVNVHRISEIHSDKVQVDGELIPLSSSKKELILKKLSDL